jgi:DNA polymerase-3 subunit alpha
MNISQYLIDNNLAHTWLKPNKVFNIGDNNYCVIEAKDDRILDETFDLILDDQDAELIQQFSCKYLVFELGEWIFYTDTEKTKLNPLKYIHKAFKSTPYTHLGVHGMYEICNGSRNYKDWCKKAKFLGVTTLGICEYNTLAGTLQFQLDCKDVGIKSILGITALVKNSANKTYKVKLFAKNEQGWSNILKVGKAINVDNGGFVTEEQLKPLLQGNIIVFQTFDKSVNSFVSNDFEYYFQIDPVQWKSDDRDREHLENLKSIVDLGLPAIILCDSYYLDKQDARIKETLNKIGKINRDYLSTDQWFKTKEEVYGSLIELFENKEKGRDFIDRAFNNADRLGNECDFKIDLSSFHLPQYTLNKVEDLLNADKYELFWNLIDNGLRNKVVNKNLDQNIYYERIQTEFEIIDKGGFVDYFLMLADIVKFCEDNRILVGAGRGSAAGSLIAYLLNITKIDPLEYGLIFERFLNPSRIKSSLPDIDTDIASYRREEVIKYIKERYGSDNVCSIGSYGQLKIKSAIQDLGRLSSIPPQTVNFYTSMMDKAGDEFDYIFETASSNPKFKEFIQENYDLVNELPLVIGNFRNTSIHASGIIVTPKNHNGKEITVYEWMPVKKVDGELISEWDGVLLDKAGFLKADILGLKELDKFSDILSLIKKNAKDAPNIYELAPNDKNVYQLFKDGLTQDAFQFGTDGLIQYCTEVKPTSLGELAAINSLYRPGPMGSNAHNDYVKIKMGRKEPHYDWGCEDITKSTYSLIVYQEQIIKICQIVAGFSLSEADEIRKATGKKLLDKMVSYKKLFIEGAVKKGCPQEEAKNIWNKIEIFASYSFNLSHAVTYSYMGYIGQYLKYYFPIEFWTVSLQKAKEEEVPKRISEINRSQSIKILSPDINKSEDKFISDFETNSIYWSIGKIRNVGEVALKTIIEERSKNGKFFSMQEFISRVDKRKVNKTCITNLILSGCFDIVEGIKTINDRYKLLIKLFEYIKEDVPEGYSNKPDWFWFLEQKRVSGSGLYDYKKLLPSIKTIEEPERYYLTFDKIDLQDNLDCEVLVIGVLTEIIERKSKKGMFAQLTIDQNNAICSVNIWNESWEIYKDMLLESENKIVALQGKIVFDNWKKKQCVHSISTTKIEIIA